MGQILSAYDKAQEIKKDTISLSVRPALSWYGLPSSLHDFEHVINSPILEMKKRDFKAIGKWQNYHWRPGVPPLDPNPRPLSLQGSR